VIKLWFLNSGFCTVSEHHIMQGSPKRLVKAHALAMLLEHPKEGLILFDTGYAPRVLEAFNSFPYSIYGRLTPTTTQKDWSVVSQLATLGFSAQDIRYIIVSHLHADHISGLKDFPKATVILSKKASGLLSLKGFAALKHGFLPMLFSQDSRVKIVDHFSDESLDGLGNTCDLFKDGWVRLVDLPGHARGQIGALIQTVRGSALLAADGAWTSQAFRENRSPHSLPLRLAFDNAAETLETLKGLHRFYQRYPEIKIIPTHCPEIASFVIVGKPVALEVLP
jgi:glyoxylase-like metal-dependent hydrolase (beta-lactamase superfamily II)